MGWRLLCPKDKFSSVLSTLKLGFKIFSSCHKCTRLLLTLFPHEKPIPLWFPQTLHSIGGGDAGKVVVPEFLEYCVNHTALRPHAAEPFIRVNVSEKINK